MLTTCCPAGESLTPIPEQTCPENFGQIQKIIFQRLNAAPSLTDTSIITRAGWQPLFAELASSATASEKAKKCVITPFVEGPKQDPGAARTFGSGNEVLGGLEVMLGREPSPFTCTIRGAQQSVVVAMKKLECESLGHNLGVFLLNENGQIECLSDGTNCLPIPIESFFISDKVHGGLEELDHNDIQFKFRPNYSDTLKVYTPTVSSFNPLTDLKEGMTA